MKIVDNIYLFTIDRLESMRDEILNANFWALSIPGVVNCRNAWNRPHPKEVWSKLYHGETPRSLHDQNYYENVVRNSSNRDLIELVDYWKNTNKG